MASRPLVFSTLVAVVAMFGGARASCAAPPSDAEILSKTDEIAADFLRKPGAVGLSIGIARKGRVVVAKGYGLADAEFDVPANKDTMFRIGSVTKEFTAAAIMRLVEQGKIRLDDELGQYLPDFPLQGNTVTIRQLLDHTSGIPTYTDLEAWGKVIPLELSHAEVLALVQGKPFDFKPGERSAYNNTAYHMLGMIIEKISGATYAEHMQEELFTPLQLERTRYDSNSALIKNRAQGYTLQGRELANDLPFGVNQPFAAGALLSTGEDLVKWSMALTSGKVVARESFAQMATTTILPNGEDTHFGLGLQIDEWEGRRRIRHGGLIFGFNAMLIWLPEDDVHIAVISNSQPVPWSKTASALAREAAGIQKAVVKDVPVPPELLQGLAGEYKLWGRVVRIEADGDKVRMNDQVSFMLLWQGPEVGGGAEFRASFDNNVRLIFAPDRRSFTLFDDGGPVKAERVAIDRNASTQPAERGRVGTAP